MLLRYAVLFLNILVTVSKRSVPLVDGWVEGEHPILGGVYWMDFDDLVRVPFSDKKSDAWTPVVVLRRLVADKYRVIRMSRSPRGPPALPHYKAAEFFGFGVMLQATTLANLNYYYIFPHEKYEVEGDPEIMQAREGGIITTLLGDGLDRLIALSGMVDGWNLHDKHGPQLGAVYWTHVRDFVKQAKLGVFVPFLILNKLQDGNKYRVVRMAFLSEQHDGKRAVFKASKFFKPEAKLHVCDKIIGLHFYEVVLHDNYEVECYPNVMKRWETGDLTIMPKEGLERLVAALDDGMVDGWDESDSKHVLILGSVYWIRPRFLGLEDKFEKYIPCVVLNKVGNMYRVVRMSGQFAQPASHYFKRITKMQTGKTTTDLKNYYIDPRKNYRIKGDPAIMQRWEKGDLTVMPKEGVERLVEAIDDGMVDGWDESDPNHVLHSGSVYWIRPHFLGLEDKFEKYMPCVVLNRVRNKYRVVRMSGQFAHPANHYFKEITEMQTGKTTTSLKKYYIDPREAYEIEGDPTIMQRWKWGELTIMPPEGVNELEAMIASLDHGSPSKQTSEHVTCGVINGLCEVHRLEPRF